jgi:putative transposase
MDVALLTRMKELEAENARLKKRYADERLKTDSLQEALRKN